MRVSLLIAALAIGCKANESGPPSKPTSGPPVIGPVSVDEARPLLPAAKDFVDVRTVTDVMQGKGGRAGVELCFETGTPEDAWNKLSDRVGALGWTEVIKQNRATHGKDSILVAARRAPFTLTGGRAPLTRWGRLALNGQAAEWRVLLEPLDEDFLLNGGGTRTST